MSSSSSSSFLSIFFLFFFCCCVLVVCHRVGFLSFSFCPNVEEVRGYPIQGPHAQRLPFFSVQKTKNLAEKKLRKDSSLFRRRLHTTTHHQATFAKLLLGYMKPHTHNYSHFLTSLNTQRANNTQKKTQNKTKQNSSSSLSSSLFFGSFLANGGDFIFTRIARKSSLVGERETTGVRAS